MARMASRPRCVTVWFRGIPYTLDLVKCRRALVARQVDGDLDSMESLAKACDISRSTASRFFSGRPTSLTVTLKILEALHLKFKDVCEASMTPVPPYGGNEEDGPLGLGALRRKPRRPDLGGAATVGA